jgi:hypothetical protein
MSRKKISQNEAHGLRRQVEFYKQREAERTGTWCRSYPGGVHIASLDQNDSADAYREVMTARKIGMPVIVVVIDKQLLFYAVKP